MGSWCVFSSGLSLRREFRACVRGLSSGPEFGREYEPGVHGVSLGRVFMVCVRGVRSGRVFGV